MGFSTTSDSPLFEQLVQAVNDHQAFYELLVSRRSEIDETFIVDDQNDWNEIPSLALIAIRALAGGGGFTEMARGLFKSRYARNHDLMSVADAVFKQNDREFLTKLKTEDRRSAKALMVRAGLID